MNINELKKRWPDIEPSDSSRTQKLAEMYTNERFPRSAKYDPQWVVDNAMGPHPLWFAEWLCQDMELKADMRVLDLGCGKAITSIFLAKEFGVQVWATDLWVSPSENWKRIQEAEVQDRVFPVHGEARALPYGHGFFDAIVSIDSYPYYGTDDLYLNYVSKFVRPAGQMGIAQVGLTQGLPTPMPAHLSRKYKSGYVFWEHDCWSFHTVDWWRHLWERTDLVDIEMADVMPDGWLLWLQDKRCQHAAHGWPSEHWPHGNPEADTLLADQGRYINFVRMIARRRAT